MISRDQALELVNKHIQNKGLVKHCIAVEGAMISLARHFKADEDLWGLAGLLHDADWEVTANDIKNHTKHTVKWVEEIGDAPEEVKQAVLAHNFLYDPDQRQPAGNMEWSLSCCDELTGLITASCLVLPDRKLTSLKISSILKKFKNPAFAAAVNRDDIKRCEEKLNIPLEEFTKIVLDGMVEKAEELGL